jgi:hypothetical protein
VLKDSSKKLNDKLELSNTNFTDSNTNLNAKLDSVALSNTNLNDTLELSNTKFTDSNTNLNAKLDSVTLSNTNLNDKLELSNKKLNDVNDKLDLVTAELHSMQTGKFLFYSIFHTQ